jgi:hypothetical protein
VSLYIISDANPGAKYIDWVLYCDDYDFQPLTLEVTDRFGNASTCTTQVKLGEQPVAVCKDIQVNVGSGNRTISPADIYGGVPFSPCIQRFPPTMSLDRNSFSCADIGEETAVTLTLTDRQGITTTCTSTVTVFDGGISSLNCGTIPVVLEDGDQRTIDISNHYSASDACSDVTVSAEQDIVTVDCDDFGENLILVTATDGNGNTATCNVVIQVSSPPGWTANCENLTVDLDQNGQAVINHRSFLSYGNQCPNDPKVAEYNQYLRYNVRNYSGGDGFLNGGEFTQDYTFTLTSNDVGNNSIWMRVFDSRTGSKKECISTITVIDNPAPVAVCQNTTVSLDQNGSATISVEDIDNGSSDENGEIVDRVLDISSFNCSDAQLGQRTVTLTVTDDGGRTDQCTATVTIKDEIAPTAVCQNVTVQLDADGKGSTTTEAVNNGSKDNCGIASLVLDKSSFMCSELGSENTVTLTVTDVNGLQSTCTATVTVEDPIAPKVTCQDLTIELENGQASIPTSAILLTKTDNCDFKTVETQMVNFDCSDAGQSIEVTHTVYDEAGNPASCTQKVTVKDASKPVPEVASLPTVEGECFVTLTPPTATDDCKGSLIATTDDPLTYIEQGTYTVTWIYDDGNGNVETQTQMVIVKDISKPVPDVASLPTVESSCSATLTAPTATDNCAGTITGTTDDPLTYTEQGSYTVTWSYDDGNGNVETQTQKVIIKDVSKPVPDLAVLPTISAECSATVSTIPTATDNCGGTITGTTEDPLFYSKQGSYTITWSYDDGNGSVATQTQTVIVKDVSKPVPDLAVLPTFSGECSVTVSAAPTATDNCEGTISGTTNDPLSYSEQGTYTITWTFDDGNGNKETQTQTVIVKDVSKPVPDLAELPTITVECLATITAPTATDNCVGKITATTDDPLTYTEQGTYTITWTFDDGNGNKEIQTQTVVVKDNSKPIPDHLSLPTIRVECSATVTAPTATDNCAGSITGKTDDPLTYTEQGSYTITWAYDDGNGNVETQMQTVIVEDNSKPVPDQAELPVVSVECSATVTAPTATDNCAGSITGTTDDPLTYSEQGSYSITWTYDDGNGNVETQTQTVIVEDVSKPVPDQAELPVVSVECSATVTAPTATDNCAGSITGTTDDPLTYTEQGTYTITWTYDDGNGNVETQTQTVIVKDISKPVPDVKTLPTITGECSATVSEAPIATDNCAGTIIGTTNDPLSYTEQGTYTITWTYDDGNGNIETQTQTVIVKDVTKPVPDVASLPTIRGECSATVTAVPTATDNCAGSITGKTNDDLTFTGQGTYTITWIYDDGNGNVTTQTQEVVVDDVTKPVPDIAELPELRGECSVTVSSAPTATDNCKGTIIGTTTNPRIYTEQGSYTITWTFDDDNGNVATQTQEVVVEDQTAPTALCKTTTVSLDKDGQAVIKPSDIDNGSFDNCGLESLLISFTIPSTQADRVPRSEIQVGCLQVGMVSVKLTATDIKGFQSSCDVLVTVSSPEPCLPATPPGIPMVPSTGSDPNPLPNSGGLPFGTINSIQNAGKHSITSTSQAKLEAFPNPFQSNLTIRYHLPQEDRATIEIINLQGQVVRTLASEVMPAGQHQINWNAQDDRGQVLPSGMYLVRMVSGKAMKIEKVLLQR